MTYFEGISGGPIHVRQAPMGEIVLTIGTEFVTLSPADAEKLSAEIWHKADPTTKEE